MKLSLAIQCINTWNLTPATEEMQVYVDGNQCPHTAKKSGYLIITKDLPSSFCLEIVSKTYLPIKTIVEDLPKDKIIICEFVMKNAPKDSVLIEAEPPASIVLGYGYYRIANDINSNDTTLKIVNPKRANIEGKHFLLRDTKSETEEFIILNDALEITLTTYRVDAIKNSYSMQSSVLLPAFFSNTNQKIPISRPPENAAIFIYEKGQKRKL